ncbi:hypothetical protein JWG42_06625 [Desulfoprunum benzoelyticum]|nr:hypothetical protein [Desulfoprunum benzoelyticum]
MGCPLVIEKFWERLGLKKVLKAIELQAFRRIETHVKICVLALQIERVAEISCGLPWQAYQTGTGDDPDHRIF